MAVPPKDGATRPCGGVAPNFKCDQMATFWSSAPKSLLADDGAVGPPTGEVQPPLVPAAPKYPSWSCPLGHFESTELSKP